MFLCLKTFDGVFLRAFIRWAYSMGVAHNSYSMGVAHNSYSMGVAHNSYSMGVAHR